MDDSLTTEHIFVKAFSGKFIGLGMWLSATCAPVVEILAIIPLLPPWARKIIKLNNSEITIIRNTKEKRARSGFTRNHRNFKKHT
jgi:hypothetical protein